MRILTKAFYVDAFSVLKATGVSFGEDKATKMAASLSYYTIFALAPLIIIIMAIVGIVWGEDAAQGRIFTELNELIGPDAAATVQSIVQNLNVGRGSSIATIIGVGTLAFSSTKVFIEMQDTLNMIFNVKPKPKRGWVKMLLDRLLSFSIVLSLGFILIVSFIASGLITALSTSIVSYLPDVFVFGYNLFDTTTLYVLDIVNNTLSFLVLSFLFGCIFKFLPDIKIRWKDVRSGAFFTAVLFMIGKWGIGLYMTQAAPGSAYGAAGTLIIILLWIFYAANILFLGAEFTKQNAEMFGMGIQPSSIAVKVRLEETSDEEDGERSYELSNEAQDPKFPNA
ncbi:YihY/virulence factor BrkB family protein [Olivibacter sitiensis]|uniref:YihY/virulence factor BrkB family protein n=1 Tax=Olivibacter sitiensis TaxID=376470 RepID=UPI0004164C0B|nr:YihY/virulence factor BrkB family protein [Olivibacter sitiensis]